MRYYDDNKLPFRVLRDVPFIIKRLTFKSMICRNCGDRSKGVKHGEDELIRFYENNSSGVANMTVYLFWICTSFVFNEGEVCSFPVEFVNELRQEFLETYKSIYFNYLIRLKQTYMDAIIEILPFFLAETVRHALIVKLKGHEVPLGHKSITKMLCSVAFAELFGYEASDLYIKYGKKRFFKRYHKSGWYTGLDTSKATSSGQINKHIRCNPNSTLSTKDGQNDSQDRVNFKVDRNKDLYKPPVNFFNSTLPAKREPEDKKDRDPRK